MWAATFPSVGRLTSNSRYEGFVMLRKVRFCKACTEDPPIYNVIIWDHGRVKQIFLKKNAFGIMKHVNNENHHKQLDPQGRSDECL